MSFKKEQAWLVCTLIVGFASGFICAVSSCREKPKAPQPTDSNSPLLATTLVIAQKALERDHEQWHQISLGMTNLGRLASQAGFVLGWEASKSGGTTEDYILLLSLIHSNRIDEAAQWFNNK